MIKNFLIINCTGKIRLIGLKINDNFFIEELQTKIDGTDELVNNIAKILKNKEIKMNKNFSILVNMGPGSFSAIRTSISAAKGIKISVGAEIYGFKNSDLGKFDLKNIEFLIEKNLLENKLIKPIYLS
tara:strand:+ start:12271 stop:12654 length:384 start_codon:yes stop_codon:yes gene_type:complete